MTHQTNQPIHEAVFLFRFREQCLLIIIFAAASIVQQAKRLLAPGQCRIMPGNRLAHAANQCWDSVRQLPRIANAGPNCRPPLCHEPLDIDAERLQSPLQCVRQSVNVGFGTAKPVAAELVLSRRDISLNGANTTLHGQFSGRNPLGKTSVRRLSYCRVNRLLSLHRQSNIAWIGSLTQSRTLAQLSLQVEHVLQRIPQVIGDGAKQIRKVAWCSGGAQGYFEAAVAQGADAYITGEISEQNFHLANETGVAFIAAGHYAHIRT